MTAPFRPRHLSVSSVTLYGECPARYHARYVARLAEPTSPQMTFGSAFHAALEAEHRGADSERALIDAWNAAETKYGASPVAGKAHALELLNRYRALGLGGKLGEPEKKFSLRLPTPNVPVPVLGFIDLAIPERRRFREFKTTSSTSWDATRIALEYQLHVYGWAYQRTYNHRPECAEYVIFGTNAPTVELIPGYPSPDGLRLFETAAEAAWAGIVAGRFDGCGEAKCVMCTPPTVSVPTGPTLDLGALS